VIIPAYNAERYIGEAIDSVLAQTCPDVECVVVDDGSTDRTAAIVKAYGEKVKYIYQKNAERSVARNRGIAESSGDFISFLDADDYIAPTKVEEQLAFLDMHPECSAVYSRVGYFRQDGRRYEIRRSNPVGDITGQLLYANFINLGSPLVRRPFIERIGGFDSTLPEIILNEDWDFWLRLAISGVRFGFINSCHLYYRLHPGNTSKDRLRSYESKLRVAEKIVRQFSDELHKKGIDPIPALAFHHADYGRGLILHGRIAEGRAEIAKACSTAFPYRRLFQAFSLVAAMGGRRLLMFLQLLRRGEL
jgi:glycosyltransferase involved in cell wall biosynthesis